MQPDALYVCDPGLRSGWATWTPEKIESGILDPMPQCDHLEAWAARQRGRRAEVIFEAYRITSETALKSQQPWSLELIGVGRRTAYREGLTFVDPLPTPAQAKKFCPDDRLHALGLWVPGKEDHERDALRHLVLALAKRRLIRIPV